MMETCSPVFPRGLRGIGSELLFVICSLMVDLLELTGAVSGTNQGPSALASISVTSLCVWSKGNPCGMRVIGLSYRSDTLYGSKRPSAAVGAQRTRRASISLGVIG